MSSLIHTRLSMASTRSQSALLPMITAILLLISRQSTDAANLYGCQGSVQRKVSIGGYSCMQADSLREHIADYNLETRDYEDSIMAIDDTVFPLENKEKLINDVARASKRFQAEISDEILDGEFSIMNRDYVSHIQDVLLSAKRLTSLPGKEELSSLTSLKNLTIVDARSLERSLDPSHARISSLQLISVSGNKDECTCELLGVFQLLVNREKQVEVSCSLNGTMTPIGELDFDTICDNQDAIIPSFPILEKQEDDIPKPPLLPLILIIVFSAILILLIMGAVILFLRSRCSSGKKVTKYVVNERTLRNGDHYSRSSTMSRTQGEPAKPPMLRPLSHDYQYIDGSPQPDNQIAIPEDRSPVGGQNPAFEGSNCSSPSKEIDV